MDERAFICGSTFRLILDLRGMITFHEDFEFDDVADDAGPTLRRYSGSLPQLSGDNFESDVFFKLLYVHPLLPAEFAPASAPRRIHGRESERILGRRGMEMKYETEFVGGEKYSLRKVFRSTSAKVVGITLTMVVTDPACWPRSATPHRPRQVYLKNNNFEFFTAYSCQASAMRTFLSTIIHCPSVNLSIMNCGG